MRVELAAMMSTLMWLQTNALKASYEIVLDTHISDLMPLQLK